MKKTNAIFAAIAMGVVLTIGSATTSMAHSGGGHGGHDDGHGDDHSGLSGEMSGRDSDRAAGNEREDRIDRVSDDSVRDREGNDDSWGDIAHCRSLYRAYDANSRTFLAHDGHRHFCP